MSPLKVEIVGAMAGAGRVEAGSGGAVEWSRPRVASVASLKEGRGVGLEIGDELLVQGGTKCDLYEIFAGMGTAPTTLYSWLADNDGGGSYRVGRRTSFTQVALGEVVFLPKEKPVLKITGI